MNIKMGGGYNDLKKKEVEFEIFIGENHYFKIYDLTNQSEFYQKVMDTEFKNLSKNIQNKVVGFAIVSPESNGRLILKTDKTSKDNFYIFGEYQGKWSGIEMNKLNSLTDEERRIFNHEQLALNYYQDSQNIKRYVGDIWEQTNN